MRSKIKHIAAGSKILLRYFSTEQDWHRAGYWKRAYGIAKSRIRKFAEKFRSKEEP